MPKPDALPTERDFDPFGGCLDARYAWKMFGGLTLDQARAVFREDPLNRQEDFMFMGGRAFAYYFPVVEDHLRGVADGSYYDRQARILARCIELQFSNSPLEPGVLRLAPRVLALADHVRGHLEGFASDEDERRKIAEAWDETAKTVESAVREQLQQ